MSSLGLTLGVVEIATLLSTLLFGLVTAQYYWYQISGFNDTTGLKNFVAALYAFEFLHLLNSWVYLYKLTVTGYGDSGELVIVTWNVVAIPILNGLTAALPQIYFANRIRVISGKIWIYAFLVVGTIARIGLLLAVAVTIKISGNLITFQARYRQNLWSVFAVSSVMDITNAAGMCYCLWVKRTETPYKSTRALLHRLMIWSVETGLITSVCQVMALVTFVAFPSNFFWLGLTLFYSRLYSNSTFASLNGRTSLRRHNDREILSGITADGQQHFNSSTQHPMARIFVSREVDISRETDVEMAPIDSKPPLDL